MSEVTNFISNLTKLINTEFSRTAEKFGVLVRKAATVATYDSQTKKVTVYFDADNTTQSAPYLNKTGHALEVGQRVYIFHLFGNPAQGWVMMRAGAYADDEGGGGSGGIADVSITGSGNAVTTASYNSDTTILTLTKGDTFVKNTDIIPVNKGGTGQTTTTGVVNALKSDLLDVFYPVGSIYTSTNSTSPSTLFGGTWTQIKDTFLLTAGDTYTAGNTGGAATVTLTEAEIPSHTHESVSLVGTGGDIMTDATTSGGLSNSGIVTWEAAHRSRDFNGATGNGMHTIKIDATHEHESFGGDGAHNNMPPYLVVYAWERVS